MKKIYLLLHCFIALGISAQAQHSRYIIKLKDKKGTAFSIANPSAYLSAKALERRSKQKISIDSTDLPVSAAYLDSIRSIPNVTILNKSNWLNQVCIRTTDANALVKINSLPFVSSSSAIGARLLPSTSPVSKISEELSESSIQDQSSVLRTNVFNYGNTFNQVHIHNGEFLHNGGFTGGGVTIAMLDAGFFQYKTNPVFDSVRSQNRVLGEWDFVANEQSVNEDNSHGMFCFSIIAANRPGSMVGTAPHAKFYLFRTEDVGSEYPVEEQNWVAAAELADSLGTDMISSSLGYITFDDPTFNHSYADRNGNTSIITRGADLAAKKGIIVMNSAGNFGGSSNDTKYVLCPADGDSVVAVGAVDVNGNLASLSSWGPNSAGKRKPNIVSVGRGTTIAAPDGNPGTGNGTSFSNPNVAGLVACLWQAFPELKNMEIIEAVERSSHKFNNPDDRFGYGIPDFKKAFSDLTARNFQGTVSVDRCVTTVSWTGKDDRSMWYDIERKTSFDTGFIKIASIPGRFELFSVNSYTYKDSLKLLATGSVQYRLKEVIQEDTSITLMNVAVNVTEVCNTGNAGIVVSPSPFRDNINVIINTPGAIPEMSISLHNMKGQRLYYYKGSKSNGAFSLQIPGYGLPAGTYIVTVRDSRKILISRQVLK